MSGYARLARIAGLATGALVTSMALAAVPAKAPPAQPSGPAASANDTARVMAGFEPSAGSPLASVAADPLWNQYAKTFQDNWSRLDERQMSKVRAFSAKNVKQQSPVLYYMFSGPDYLYADALMPAANTYVMSGLEPVGTLPDLRRLNARELTGALNELRHSMASLLDFSFFQTKLMSGELRYNRIYGTTPILMVFLSRAGKTIYTVDFYDLASDGTLHPPEEKIATSSHAVKFTFSDSIGPKKTLYYFSTDVANSGVRSNGFLKFCDKFGMGDSLVKGASYLMHGDNFSEVRNFVLTHSRMILQDDTGVPVRFLEKGWKLQPYGSYVGPIRLFPGNVQAGMFKLFREQKPGELSFGIGYRYRLGGSNLVLAMRDENAAANPEPAPAATPAKTTDSAPAPRVQPEPRSEPRPVYRRRNQSKSASNPYAGLFGYTP